VKVRKCRCAVPGSGFRVLGSGFPVHLDQDQKDRLLTGGPSHRFFVVRDEESCSGDQEFCSGDQEFCSATRNSAPRPGILLRDQEFCSATRNSAYVSRNSRSQTRILGECRRILLRHATNPAADPGRLAQRTGKLAKRAEFRSCEAFGVFARPEILVRLLRK